MHDELWRKIVILHNTNKSLFIWCEENEIDLKSFLQPNNEFKNAWEHAVRAKANELGMSGDPNEKYQIATLEDTLSHEYRAFFDICDWASVILRRRAIDLLKSYDQAIINAVIPNYYSEIRPNFEEAAKKIADLRGGKDIAQQGDIMARVEEYNSILVNLTSYTRIITQSVSVMILRKRIQDELAPYDADSIKEIIPNYWSEIHPNLEVKCNLLADLIKSKGETVNQGRCKEILSSINADAEKISQCLPTLAEYDRRKESTASKSWRNEFWAGAFLGVIVGVISSAALVYFEHLKDVFFPPKK